MDNQNKTEEQLLDEAYPSKDFKKTQYTFSAEEMESLKPLEDATALVKTLMALGEIAQRAKDGYVGGQVLERLGIKRSPDVKVTYDMPSKKILVYEPRLWCSQCNEKRAEFKYQDKIFCSTCIEDVRKTIGQPVEQPEVAPQEAEEPKKEKKTKLTK